MWSLQQTFLLPAFCNNKTHLSRMQVVPLSRNSCFKMTSFSMPCQMRHLPQLLLLSVHCIMLHLHQGMYYHMLSCLPQLSLHKGNQANLCTFWKKIILIQQVLRNDTNSSAFCFHAQDNCLQSRCGIFIKIMPILSIQGWTV